MADEHDKAMAATVGGMTHLKRPIAREDQELLDRAVECFGDFDKAPDWLQAPNAALNSRVWPRLESRQIRKAAKPYLTSLAASSTAFLLE